MLHLAIVDAEIELVPPEIAGHPAIVRRARQRGKDPAALLLDSSADYRAMNGLADYRRRGRPDIAHLCLLNALGSIPCKEGALRVYLHTRQDLVLAFDRRTRLPRTQSRFYGLLEGLVSEGRGTGLITLRRMSLRELWRRLAPDVCLGLTRRGEKANLSSELSGGRTVMAMIGGFPEGGFRSPVCEFARLVSCYEHPLDAWTVVNEVICAYRSIGSQRT